jgi:hypothetical protein
VLGLGVKIVVRSVQMLALVSVTRMRIMKRELERGKLEIK